jgi:hypothetical protein
MIQSPVRQHCRQVGGILPAEPGFAPFRETNTPALIEIPSDVVALILKPYSNRLAAKRILLDYTVDKCPPVNEAAGQLKQVIANLMANAIHAVAKGGKIAFASAKNSLRGAAFLLRLPNQPRRRQALLRLPRAENPQARNLLERWRNSSIDKTRPGAAYSYTCGNPSNGLARTLVVICVHSY